MNCIASGNNSATSFIDGKTIRADLISKLCTGWEGEEAFKDLVDKMHNSSDLMEAKSSRECINT